MMTAMSWGILIEADKSSRAVTVGPGYSRIFFTRSRKGASMWVKKRLKAGQK